MGETRRTFIKTALVGTAGGTATLGVLARSTTGKSRQHYLSALPENVERTFVGPEFWANRLQDWQIRGGRFECRDKRPESPMRTLHLLTHRLATTPGAFKMRVRTGLLESGEVTGDAATGFLVGAGGESMDYRAAALIHHQPGPGGGWFAGCDAAGQAFFRDFSSPLPKRDQFNSHRQVPIEIDLELTATDAGELILVSRDSTGRELSRATQSVPVSQLVGNVALVSHPGTGQKTARFWFKDWEVVGARITKHADQICGPIVGALYTVHDGVLKLTAQLAPLGRDESQTAELQMKRGATWRTVKTATIESTGWVARFRVSKWDDRKEVPYRVRYRLKSSRNNRTIESFHYWEGTIAGNPIAKEEVILASLSCVQQVNGPLGANPAFRWNYNVNFPHPDLTPNLKKQQADIYFFAGDQIYEGNPTRMVQSPVEEATLDYLYKWYLWCWSFADVVRHRPCVCIPDDHDVYHGNIWGDGGRAAAPGDPAGLQGGYGMPPAWLNMIQKTQTSHLPDAWDPSPVAQGIEVYFTSLVWGGIGFAILEDRKFKSSPSIVKARMTRDSHITEKDFDIRNADQPGSQLLGERQLRFLHDFAADWRGQQMKACLSQTIFCNLQISSRPPTTGELDKDLDSNGWPQSGRKAALRELRRGFMVHIAGDQHLASALQHGIEEYGDACWSQCSPAIANVYTRFWNPDYPPLEGGPLAQPFSGNYVDGFQNKLTIHAVANPVDKPMEGQFPEPMELHRKSPGYNIIRFNKDTRTIRFECWPRYADPATGRQYPGWPITINQTDNYGRKPFAWLPVLQVEGLADPVLQVVEEATGEILYTLRIKGHQFRPKVFAPGSYTINIGEPGTKRFQTLRGLTPSAVESVQKIEL
ncbi:MAG: twin-arginine translocation pathway signal protein [Acidobacteria bacterium]|nr:twin-arginine translocation pathway signal protein [Acidobacteriota bacterium]